MWAWQVGPTGAAAGQIGGALLGKIEGNAAPIWPAPVLRRGRLAGSTEEETSP